MTTKARRLFVVIGSVIVSVVFLMAAFIVHPNNSRLVWQAMFVTVGVAVLLVIPIEWANQHLRTDVQEAARDQQKKVEEVEERTEAKISELGQRLTDLEKLDQQSREAHDEARNKDHEIFDAVITLDARGEVLNKALSRAERLWLINRQGVWTNYSAHSYLSVRFHNMSGDRKRVEARLYAPDRREVLGRAYIDTDRPNKATIDRLRELARRNGDGTTPTVSVIFKGLADTLKFAESHPEDAPMLQYFSPQWALTETAIIAPSRGQKITHKQLDRVDRDVEMKKKSWLDYDPYHEAHYAAERQFPLTDEQRRVGGLDPN